MATSLALAACHHRPRAEAPRVVETQWTRNAAERTERLIEAAGDPQHGGTKYALPQLRVYDADGQLVYLLDPTRAWSPQMIGSVVDRAIASRHPIAGPSLSETLVDLQTPDGRPASAVVARSAPLVFDYWASWCAPCKVLEKALLQWQAHKPADSVQIVKAEADPTKLVRERGEKIIVMKKGPDGKLHKTEIE